MTKLFITGATGYIGGEILYTVANAYPDLEITAMVRTSDKGAKIAAQYASIRLVYGDLSSSDVITQESANADIVIHTADCDDAPSAKAIVAGLAQRNTTSYLIHTSGTGILAYEDAGANTYGIARDLVFDDWGGIGQVTSIPDAAIHTHVGKIVLAAKDASSHLRSAIVCPPCIWGPGRGPDNQRSVQAYDMVKAGLKRHKGFVVGDGLNRWTEVHVQDLSTVYLGLVTAALEGEKSKATWNDEGYYFAENGEFVWGDLAREITNVMADKKLVNSKDMDSVTPEQANELRAAGAYLWGTNSRCRAIRAGKLLGWKAKHKGLLESVPDIVDGEARALGLIKGHAAVAAGETQLT